MRLTLLTGALLASVLTFAQNSKVTSATFKFQDQEYKEAAEYINEAAGHPKTSVKAKTWFTRAQIYAAIATESAKYPELGKTALDETFSSVKKAVEFDDRGKYTRKLEPILITLYNAFYTKGSNERMDQNYEAAVKAFQTTEEVQKYATEKELATIPDNIFTTYFIGESHLYNEDTAKAVESFEFLFSDKDRIIQNLKEGEKQLQQIKELAEKTGQEIPLEQNTNPYKSIIEVGVSNYVGILNAQQKFDKALEITSVGQDLLPGNQNIIVQELNVYIQSGRSEEAVEKFEAAAEADPNNADIKAALGTIYDQLKEKAIEEGNEAEAKKYETKIINTYKGAIELNPDAFIPNYNLGTYYYNKGVEINDEMNKLGMSKEDQKKFNALKEKQKSTFKEALPYLEKAHEVSPDEMATMDALSKVYFLLEMFEENKAIKEKMGK